MTYLVFEVKLSVLSSPKQAHSFRNVAVIKSMQNNDERLYNTFINK